MHFVPAGRREKEGGEEDPSRERPIRHREREAENERDTYIWLLGIILCPSLYHVTRGRGKEARGGRLMIAGLP